MPKLNTWIINNNGHNGDAKDILQESLSSIIIAHTKKKKTIPNNFEAYLFSICKYKWLDHLKKRNIKNRVTFDTASIHISESSIQEEYILMEYEQKKYQILERTFLLLGDLCQRLLNLVKEGLSAKGIAAELDMTSQSTVNRRKFACMQSWRKKLQQDNEFKLLKEDE